MQSTFLEAKHEFIGLTNRRDFQKGSGLKEKVLMLAGVIVGRGTTLLIFLNLIIAQLLRQRRYAEEIMAILNQQEAVAKTGV